MISILLLAITMVVDMKKRFRAETNLDEFNTVGRRERGKKMNV